MKTILLLLLLGSSDKDAGMPVVLRTVSLLNNGSELAYLDSNGKAHCPKGVQATTCYAALAQVGVLKFSDVVMDK